MKQNVRKPVIALLLILLLLNLSSVFYCLAYSNFLQNYGFNYDKTITQNEFSIEYADNNLFLLPKVSFLSKDFSSLTFISPDTQYTILNFSKDFYSISKNNILSASKLIKKSRAPPIICFG